MPWWFEYVIAFLLGACVGSFLNVVIYRLPLGMSVNEPKRSFCPSCKKEIPWWRNLPLISWLLLRGKCAECGAKISVRYFIVELLTAVLCCAVVHFYNVPTSVLLSIMCVLLVAISFIDAEHLIIPISLTTGGAVLAVISAWWTTDAMHRELNEVHLLGVKQAALGWVIGFFSLWLVVLLGKILFGKLKLNYTENVEWAVKEGASDDEPMFFQMENTKWSWWDMFNRKTDELHLTTSEILIDGENVAAGVMKIREEEFTLPDGTVKKFEDIRSMSGRGTRAVVPREAMGMGDPHLLGMIGAFIGGIGVIFVICASAVFALLISLLGRIGFGKQLPFGPFLALAAITWIFGGWKLWQMYLQLFHF